MNFEKAVEEFEGDKEILMDVLKGFLDNVRAQIETIYQAISNGDAEVVWKEAHSIKGGAANLNADRLSEIAFELEKVGKSGALEKGGEVHERLKKEFYRFSNRLDSFMQLSNVVVVASGGVGTVLELFYTWQLMQVKQICNVPIILLGDMWYDLVAWIRNWPLKNNLLDDEDIELLFIAKNCSETFNIIQEAYKGYKKGDENFCLNYTKYKI